MHVWSAEVCSCSLLIMCWLVCVPIKKDRKQFEYQVKTWAKTENKTHIQNERKNHGEGEEREIETATSQWKGTSRMTKHAQGNVHIKFYNFSVSFFPLLLYFAFWCFALHFMSFILAIAIANLLDDCLPFYFENYSASKEERQKNRR